MADDSKRLVELKSALSELSDKTGVLEKQLQKIDRIGQGIGTTLPHNFKKASAAIDQLITKTKELQLAQTRLSSTGGAVGAARLSAAHSTLTGQGRGGGGYGSGGVVAAPLPNKSSIEVPGVVGAAAGIGYRSMVQAIGMRGGFEQSTRFLRAGSLANGIGSLGNQLSSSGSNIGYHGYNAMESAGQRMQLIRAAGGQSEELAPGIGTEKAFQAMSNRLRNPVENLIGAAGVLRGGGLDAEDSITVLQRIQTTLESIEGVSHQTPDYLRKSAIYLESISQLSQQQLAISGSLSQKQVGAFQGVVSQLTTQGGFDPTQSANVARIMMQRTISPGGGAAGEMFQMRAFGFANPNLGAYKKTAKARGIDPSMFRRRGLFEYREYMENATLAQKAQSYLVGLETEYGGKSDAMSYVLGTALMPELGQTRARELVGMYKRGGLGTGQIEQYMQNIGGGGLGTVESALDVAKLTTTGETATLMKFKDANDQYLETILEFGGKGGVETLAGINKGLRDMQSTLVGVTAGVYGSDAISGLITSITGLVNVLKLNTSPRTTGTSNDSSDSPGTGAGASNRPGDSSRMVPIETGTPGGAD